MQSNMARPPKNNCDYFPHDNGMRNHVKVKAIRNKFPNGYAIWSMLLEFLTGSDGNTFEKTPLQMELLSGDFGVSVTEMSDVVDYCIKLELLFEKDGWIYSESLNERLAPVYEKRGKSKELSAKQQRMNGKFTGNKADSTVVSVTEIPQNKVNKKKLKKSTEEIEAQTQNRVMLFKESLYQYTKNKGGIYSAELVKSFFDYWSELNKSKMKMRWELQETFEIPKRLSTWARNETVFSKKETKKPESEQMCIMTSLFTGGGKEIEKPYRFYEKELRDFGSDNVKLIRML